MTQIYATLKEPWRECIDLAWQAYKSGSLPIAAVITDQSGKIISKGRNRIGNIGQAHLQLSNHPIAHAEVNAILQLDERKMNPKTSTLYTLLEPCPMCMGAMQIMGIDSFLYACRDPWAGSSIMADVVPDMKRRNMNITHPESKLFENCIAALQFLSYLEEDRALNKAFVHTWQEVQPIGVTLAHYLHEQKILKHLAVQGARASQVLDKLTECLRDEF